jgi:hypothetical protein
MLKPSSPLLKNQQFTFVLYSVLFWMALTWFFEGHPRLSPRTLYPYCRTLARVMQSSESPNDLLPSDMSSHILRTLDDGQMGLVLEDLVMMAHRWDESPHAE